MGGGRGGKDPRQGGGILARRSLRMGKCRSAGAERRALGEEDIFQRDTGTFLKMSGVCGRKKKNRILAHCFPCEKNKLKCN